MAFLNCSFNSSIAQYRTAKFAPLLSPAHPVHFLTCWKTTIAFLNAHQAIISLRQFRLARWIAWAGTTLSFKTTLAWLANTHALNVNPQAIKSASSAKSDGSCRMTQFAWKNAPKDFMLPCFYPIKEYATIVYILVKLALRAIRTAPPAWSGTSWFRRITALPSAKTIHTWLGSTMRKYASPANLHACSAPHRPSVCPAWTLLIFMSWTLHVCRNARTIQLESLLWWIQRKKKNAYPAHTRATTAWWILSIARAASQAFCLIFPVCSSVQSATMPICKQTNAWYAFSLVLSALANFFASNATILRKCLSTKAFALRSVLKQLT